LSFEPILLAPEQEAAELYPYRHVWRTGTSEVVVLLLAVVAVVALTRLFHVFPEDSREPFLKVAIALLPLVTWLAFSYRGERRALQPRQGLVGVLLLGALVASGVAIPLEERVFTPDVWLPRVSFFGRVLGYMLTTGLAAEFLKYAVVRYSVWPHHFRQRLDGIAYAMAAAVGYAVVLNLHAALDTDSSVTATALRVASNTFSQVAVGLIMGFFLAELRIGRPPVFWLPGGLLLAAFASGLYYAFRGIAIVGGLSVDSTGSAPLRGLALALALVLIVFAIIAFIIESSDARMEALTGRRQAL
jgi:RsiW-degrading membrane proteinase PrsW (M82 family)